jgi:hypothetical protein
MISRRSLLVSAGSLMFAAGCKKASAAPDSCAETSSLSTDERAVRVSLGYSDRAADASKACRSCQQWVEPSTDGACGGCKLLKGPIHPAGTCKAFAPKA